MPVSIRALRWRMYRSVEFSGSDASENLVDICTISNLFSVGGVGTPVVVSGGPTVAGVGIGRSVLPVVSVVPGSVVVSTAVVLGSSLVVTVEDSELLVSVILSDVSNECVVVSMGRSVVSWWLKKSSLQAKRGVFLSTFSQLSHT